MNKIGDILEGLNSTRINEAELQYGTWIKINVGTGRECYAYVYDVQKTGGSKIVMFQSDIGKYSGKATLSTTKNLATPPTKIKIEDVPDKVKLKIKAKAEEMGIDMYK
jgi:hypothetical protein